MLSHKFTTILTTGGIIALTALTPVTAFAQTTNPTVCAKRAANQEARLTMLHTLADNAISKRLTDLNTVQTRINALVKLSSNQKIQFSSEITADINGLTSLKAKCDADTDLTTLRADYRSIFTQYRVYAEFLPQVHLLAAADTMTVTADKLSDFANKLQDRINKAGNPSNLTSLLSDMQAKVADAEKQYSSAQSQVVSLTPQSYDNDPTGTTSTLKNARAEIKTGVSDLKTSWADAKQIVQVLKAKITPAPSAAQ